MDAAELNELARDSGRADTGASGETVVARLDAATRITEGQDAELWLDARKLHVFDPSTGQNLTLGDSGSHASGATTVTGGAPGEAEPTAAGQDTGSTATPTS